MDRNARAPHDRDASEQLRVGHDYLASCGHDGPCAHSFA